MVQVYPCRMGYQLAAAKHFIPPTLPSDKENNHPFGTPWQCEAEEGRNLKSDINHFNYMSNFVTCSLGVGILAHLTNGLLLETSFWDELQRKECRSVDEFYRKAHKYLKLKDFKEALHKI